MDQNDNNEHVHLVMLLGTNPLPVYVAMKYLIKHFKKIKLPVEKLTILYGKHPKTGATNPMSSAARTLLGNSSIANNKRDCFAVDPDTNESGKKLGDLLQESNYVHLHYTGGTKVMVAESLRRMYRCVRDKSGNVKLRLPRKWSYSYLSGRTHKLNWTGEGVVPAPKGSPDLRRVSGLAPSLGALLNLHGVNKRRDILHLNSEGASEFCEAVQAVGASIERDVSRAVGIQRNGYVNGWPSWNGRRCQEDSIKYLNDTLKPGSGRSGGGNGVWLEIYVAYCLQRALEEKNCPAQVAMRVKVTDLAELDVVALIGHQLIAFSCKSGIRNKKPNGSKLDCFEAWHRARQFGGDGARAVAVFSHHNNKSASRIESNIGIDIGDDPSGIEVWGQEDVENLPGKMKGYLDKLLS